MTPATCTCDGRSPVIDRYAAELAAEEARNTRLSAILSDTFTDLRNLRDHHATAADAINTMADRVAQGLEQLAEELTPERRADIRGQIAGLRRAATMIGGSL